MSIEVGVGEAIYCKVNMQNFCWREDCLITYEGLCQWSFKTLTLR